MQTAFKERCHVCLKRPVPVFNAYSRPLQPKFKFIKVPIDRKMEGAPRFIPDPSLRSAGRSKTSEVCDQQRTARFSTLAISLIAVLKSAMSRSVR
jgi:hypothetical protein